VVSSYPRQWSRLSVTALSPHNDRSLPKRVIKATVSGRPREFILPETFSLHTDPSHDKYLSYALEFLSLDIQGTVHTLPENDRSAVIHPSHSFSSRCSSALATLQADSQKFTAASWTKAMAVYRMSVADAKGV
jgi:hypothetical protein